MHLYVQFESPLEPNGKLGDSHAPVLKRGCPFLANVPIGEINQFQQSYIRWERPVGLGDFAYLTVKAFDGVGRIDQPTDGGVILKNRPKSVSLKKALIL